MNHAGWPDFIHWHTWNEKHFNGSPLKIPGPPKWFISLYFEIEVTFTSL